VGCLIPLPDAAQAAVRDAAGRLENLVRFVQHGTFDAYGHAGFIGTGATTKKTAHGLRGAQDLILARLLVNVAGWIRPPIRYGSLSRLWRLQPAAISISIKDISQALNEKTLAGDLFGVGAVSSCTVIHILLLLK